MDAIAEHIRKRKLEFERYHEIRRENGAPLKWKMRLRIKLGDRLTDNVPIVRARFRGRVVRMQSRVKGRALRDENWIVLTASRFSTVEQAVEFGLSLQSALAVGGAVSGIAVDVGIENEAGASAGKLVKDAAAKEGHFLFDDVHGLVVYPDGPASFTIFGEMQGTALRSSERLVEIMQQAPSVPQRADQRTLSAALMMNAGLMAPHPAAAIALFVGAVELLSAGQKWSPAQRQWIDAVPAYLEDAKDLSKAEKEEIGLALGGLRNFGISAGIRRFIDSVGLPEIKDRWKDLYGRRSRFLHGAEYVSYGDLLAMQADARELCSLIVKAHVTTDARRKRLR